MGPFTLGDLAASTSSRRGHAGCSDSEPGFEARKIGHPEAWALRKARFEVEVRLMLGAKGKFCDVAIGDLSRSTPDGWLSFSVSFKIGHRPQKNLLASRFSPDSADAQLVGGRSPRISISCASSRLVGPFRICRLNWVSCLPFFSWGLNPWELIGLPKQSPFRFPLGANNVHFEKLC